MDVCGKLYDKGNNKVQQKEGPMLCSGKSGELGKNPINPTRFILTVPTYLYKFCGDVQNNPMCSYKGNRCTKPSKTEMLPVCIGIVWLRRFVDLEDGVKPHDFQSHSNSLYIHPFICHSNSSNGTSFTSCPIKKQKGGSKEAHLSVNVGFHMSFGDETSIHALRL